MLIRTERLILRGRRPADEARSLEWFDSDAAVAGYGPLLPHTPAEVGRRLDEGRALIIEHAEEAVGLLRVELLWGEFVAEVADLLIAEPYIGRGFGGEALRGFIAYFFERWGGERVQLGVRADNTRALSCYRRLGFVEEGRRRNVIPPNWGPPQSRDTLVLGLLPSDRPDGPHPAGQ